MARAALATGQAAALKKGLKGPQPGRQGPLVQLELQKEKRAGQVGPAQEKALYICRRVVTAEVESVG